MTTDAEIYHDDMRGHLAPIQSRAKTGIDLTHELENQGHKYLQRERQALIAQIRAACGHKDCSIAAAYEGNAAPVHSERPA